MTSGLKRQATKKVFQQVQDELAALTKGLPTGTDVRCHWSGKANLQEAIKALRGNDRL